METLSEVLLDSLFTVSMNRLARASFLFATWQAIASARSDSISTRIVNGVVAQEGRYPYLVSLTKEGSHFCGGSLIAKDIVLTAAHCLGDTIVAKIGGHDIDEGEEILVVDQMEHPDYNDGTNQYDLALLFLEDSTTLDIALPRLNKDDDFPSPGSRTHVMGWGNTRNSGYSVSDELMRVGLEVISNEDCEEAELNRDDNYNGDIHDDMMCTDSGEQDACQGDSGGPLIVRDDDGPEGDIIVGVVSWGIGCGVMPGVFSRVSASFEWIEEMVCENSDDHSGSLCGGPTASPNTESPTDSPTLGPSLSPTTSAPSLSPTVSFQPIESPSTAPSSSFQPSMLPSISAIPSVAPTVTPTISTLPTISTPPTTPPSVVPSSYPSNSPTLTSAPSMSTRPTMSAAPIAEIAALKSLQLTTDNDEVMNHSSDRMGCRNFSSALLSSVIILMWVLL